MVSVCLPSDALLQHLLSYLGPMSKKQWLRGRRRAERSYPSSKVRRGGHEKIPLVQGKEQWLCFAGAAVKRYPTSKVRENNARFIK